jgi:hypothetical protein
MKTLKIVVVILSVVLYSCKGGFSTGVKKDLSTGLSTSYNGFAVDDVYLTVDGNKVNSNKVSLGKQILVVANGVDYYEEKNGKVFPGCSIVLTDKNGKSILNIADAFADLKDGFEPEKASMLNATISTGDPMVVGETYHLKTRFYDKQKPTSIITSEVDLVMTE